MILVQVQQIWLQVLTGTTTADEAILGDWPGISEHDLRRYGDVLVGLYGNTIVGVYDIDPEKTTSVQGRVRFAGSPSATWAHLVGKPNPGRPWSRQGSAEPVQYLDTAALAGHHEPVEAAADVRQVSLDGFVLAVDRDGNGAVTVPAGRTLLMHTAQAVEPSPAG